MMSGSSSPMPEPVVTTHVVGIDIGMESCTMSCLTMDKRQLIKSTPFANTHQAGSTQNPGLPNRRETPRVKGKENRPYSRRRLLSCTYKYRLTWRLRQLPV